MKLEISDSNIILAWAVTTFLGWIVTALGYRIPLLPSTVILIWAALMAVPVTSTVLKYYRNDSNKLFNLWAVLTVILLAQNYFTPGLQVFSYYTVWMIGVAAAYYHTYSRIPPLSKKTYLYGAALNLAVVPLIYLIPLQYFAVLAAFVQSGPVFYDWYMVHR